AAVVVVRVVVVVGNAP
ncbi:TPA: ilvB operon leader peptide IvbL, partial [Escherichia coli]